MNKLIETKYVTVETSNSIVSFEAVRDDHNGPNGHFLLLAGKRAFYMSTLCDTCPLLFERLSGSTEKVSPRDLSDQLRRGLTTLDDQTVDGVKQILPKGEYIFCLINISPRLVKPGDKNDYFCKEQVDVWGIDQFWGLPHHPKTEYYRSLFLKLNKKEQFYEFEVPLYPQTWLEQDTVSRYRELSRAKQYPTALALSVLEVREPAMETHSPAGVRRHWSLIHYLLDGHHKTNAAAREKKPLSLLACISLTESNASKDEVEQTIKTLQNQVA